MQLSIDPKAELKAAKDDFTRRRPKDPLADRHRKLASDGVALSVQNRQNSEEEEWLGMIGKAEIEVMHPSQRYSVLDALQVLPGGSGVSDERGMTCRMIVALGELCLTTPCRGGRDCRSAHGTKLAGSEPSAGEGQRGLQTTEAATKRKWRSQRVRVVEY